MDVIMLICSIQNTIFELANNAYNFFAVSGKVSLAFDATLHKESAMSNVVNMKDYHKKK
mgnify:CR=1 FL=1